MTRRQSALDDPARIAEIDRSNMLSAVASVGRQLTQGFELGRSAPIPIEFGEPWRHSAVVISGMGGSGIAGDVVRGLLFDRAGCPIVISKGYGLPAFCGPDTLLFALSYSGNTAETLAAYERAAERGCMTVSISSSGRLRELAEAKGGVHLDLPGDAPMPRAALGYLAGAVLGVLGRIERTDLATEVPAAARLLDELARRWEPGTPTGQNEAKVVAEWLGGRIPVVWGSEGLMEPVALRWKNQMNENAKVPAAWSILPELDHNEIEGWSPDTAKDFAVIALRNTGEHPRVEERFALTEEVASAAGLDVREVHADGAGPAEWLFSLVMLGDFVSTYLGILRGVDPTPVPTLTGLKERLVR